MRQITTLVVSAWLLTPTIAWAQSPAASRYRVLSANKFSTLQAELAQAANEGYRVVANAGSAVVLERSSDKYEYLISGALPQDVRDQKVPPGYRILPRTVGQIAGGPCGAIFERSPGDSVRREYRVENAVYPGNLQKDILNATAEGYRVLVIGAVAGFCAVLEREPGAAGTNAPAAGVKEAGKEKKANLGVADYSRPYVLMATTKTSTLEKEMAEAVARGHRLQSGAAADELLFLTERQDANTPKPDYILLSTTKTDTLEREMNQAVARGYRLHPLSLAGILRSMTGLFETVAVMEKRESPAVEYRVIGTSRAGTFEKELIAAGEQGWELVATVRSGAFTAVLHRPAGPR
jgi:hypothetical protein